MIKEYLNLFEPNKRADRARYPSGSTRFFSIIVDWFLLAIVSNSLFFIFGFLIPRVDSSIIAKIKLQATLDTAEKAALSMYIKKIIFINVSIIGLMLFAVYFIWHNYSTSPSGKIFNLRIVNDSDLGKPTKKQMVIRIIFGVLSILLLGIGFLWCFISRKNQTMYDYFSKTVVVTEESIASGQNIIDIELDKELYDKKNFFSAYCDMVTAFYKKTFATIKSIIHKLIKK